MKITAIASSIAAFSTLAQASINLSYEKPASGSIVSHSEVRVAWETTETYVCHPFPYFPISFH
jgi:hypothetical protein